MKNKKIALIGLGYVGLPLAVEFGKKFEVIGFDISKDRIDLLKKNEDPNLVINKNEFATSSYLSFSDSIDDIKDCNIYIVTVPTPINNHKKPDLTALKKSSETVGSVLKKDNIVIYESTVYPGATEEFCVPILEKKSGLKFNADFYCGYSPERINPGDEKHKLIDIKKVTAGSTPEIALEIDELYKEIIVAGTYKAESIKIAEAAKVIENTQRDLNIAFVNELSLIFKKMDISTEKVLKAAETKWNFISFRPGLVGGHCIGVDPYYLTYKLKQIGHNPKLILSGRSINDEMPLHLYKDIIKVIEVSKIKKPKILIMGLTFKENCPDTRNSKVLNLYKYFIKNKFSVSSYDPYSDLWSKEFNKRYNIINSLKSKKFDAIIIAVKHKEFINKKDKIKNHCSKNGFIYDLKYILSEGKKIHRP